MKKIGLFLLSLSVVAGVYAQDWKAKYQSVGSMQEGLSVVKSQGKYGYADRNGKLVIPLKFDFAGDFNGGLAPVSMNGKSGYVDRTGKVVIALRFTGARPFQEGLAEVEVNGRHGFIDRTGKVVIPLRYDRATSFSRGLSEVSKNGEVFLIDRAECRWDSRDEYESKYSNYARIYVENAVNQWQKKGKFETVAAWKERVTAEARAEQVDFFVQEALQSFIEKHSGSLKQHLQYVDYDPQSERCLMTAGCFGELLVDVPVSGSDAFIRQWSEAQLFPKFRVENDEPVLQELEFLFPDGRSFTYYNDNPVEPSDVAMEYNFDAIEWALPQGNTTTVRTVARSGKSDIDRNIPGSSEIDAMTFVVIVANENYQTESRVEFALNDGRTFYTYCCKTLGIPETNIHKVENATLNNLRREINWLKSVVSAYGGEANAIFYYAGHGIPDEATRTSYLLPVDGYGTDVSTGYELAALYRELGAMPAKRMSVFLDACFSGARRDGKMMTSARGIAIKAAQGMPSGNTVVFSAAQGMETAYPNREQGHGMFTYYLLKKWQETAGKVSYGDLFEYVHENVSRQSVVLNSKSQTPEVISGPSVSAEWRNWMLK